MNAIRRENLMRDHRVFRRRSRSTRVKTMTRFQERQMKWFLQGVKAREVANG